MERRKFLNRSLATLGLGLVFPSLIRGNKVDTIDEYTESEFSLSHGSDHLYADLRKYPMTPDECFQAFEVDLHGVLYDDITVTLSAISDTGQIQMLGEHICFAPKNGEVHFALMPKGYVRTIGISYSYKNAIGSVNLHIPVSRFKEGKFSWRADRCVKNAAGSLSLMATVNLGDGMWVDVMEGPFDRPGFIIEHWDDRVDIYLPS